MSKKEITASNILPMRDFKSILDNITEFITLCDVDFRILESNHSADMILGGGDPLRGSFCYDKYRGKTQPCEDCPLPETMSTGSIISLENYNERFGEYFEERAYPIVSDTEELEGFVLMCKNISKSREHREKSTQDKKLAALGKISSGVAHDFNNVLTGILGRARLMKKLTTDPELLKNLQVIKSAALDGAATVRRMQDFTRLRKDEEFESINLKKLIEEVIALTRPKWRDLAISSGILIELIVQLADNLNVLGDPPDLRRAFMNILFNAIDAMPDGGVLTINAQVRDGKISIQFKDVGIGMTEETIERIFDPFFSTKGVKGTGLGMSEVFGVIKRHSGKITVNSQVGKGTVITILLQQTDITAVEISKPTEVIKTKPSRILILDDEEYILGIVEEVLTDLGHEVTSYLSAEDGINQFKKDNFDIVITDLGMPDVSGWEVAERIKEVNASTPIILLTGWALNLDSEKIKENKVDFVLQKPFTKEELEKAISKVIPIAKKLKKDVIPDEEPVVQSSRILVIDDEEYILDIVEEILTDQGHKVTSSGSAENGLEIFKKENFDIVITDLGMPEMIGWEVAERIKKYNPKTPVILLTGWALNLEPEKIKENGVDYVLKKPFTEEKLTEIISKARKTIDKNLKSHKGIIDSESGKLMEIKKTPRRIAVIDDDEKV
ncbi:MAG: response regulator [Candidatus Marinimicrobia bacterium]|nr:response regulator [Candidatus Neomarinimicrobiota bacterium]